MSFTIWAIETERVDSAKEDVKKLTKTDVRYFETSLEKLELIEFVDEKIDLIIIENDDTTVLQELIYFFREFNQLLEFIPIIVVTDFSVYKEINSWENTGIIDFIDKSDTPEKLLYKIKHCYDIISRTEEMRNENYNYRTELRDNYKQLEYEKKKSEQLLLNILPEETSRELMIHGSAKPQFYKKVSVLFTDFKGFTMTCENMTPEQIVRELDIYFSKFDEITERHFGEKIKTIGDAYMCAGGIPMRNNSNPVDLVLVGLQMQEYMNDSNKRKIEMGETPWHLRVGIHTGKLIAGVIGKKKFAYDIWGDAVNTASRMESSGEPDKVNISGVTYEYVKHLFNCTYRGKVYAKNKGDIDMYFVDGIKPEFSENEDGITPNELFKSEIALL